MLASLRRFGGFGLSKVMSHISTEVGEVVHQQHRLLNGFAGAKTPFVIGVAGGTASGKSTVCNKIMESLGQDEIEHTQRQVVCITQDSFYKNLTATESALAAAGQFNFDHPDAFDEKLILSTLNDILAGKRCKVPVYDYINNCRKSDEMLEIYPADVVLFEGILAFYFPEVRELFHMKLFVDTDADIRLARRVVRDTQHRGRNLMQVLDHYLNYVKPAFEDFSLPTKKFADVIIPRGADNSVAIDLIVQHIRDLLENRNGTTESPRLPSAPGRRRHQSDNQQTVSRLH